MQDAKEAINRFMHKAGHNDTTVHEKVAPAVVNETLSKHRHEEATTAIDREVHQDHYHTSVQPVKDREVLPEEHQHNIIPVEHRSHDHGDAAAVKQRLEQEAARFTNTTTEGRTKESHSVAPVIAGEHVHHHVHETIQPVVQKETIQPSVVHTTIPIHEVHNNEAKHHSATALPALSMADFKRQGGSLTGREERYDGFEGEPKALGSALGGHSASNHGPTTGSSQTTSATHHNQLANKADPRVDSDMDGSRNAGLTGAGTTGTGSGLTGHHHNNNTTGGYGNESTGYGNEGTGYGNNTSTTGSGLGNTTSHGSGIDPATGKKPSLAQRLNPFKDTDGDGKKGVME
ncbi:hypothetical protein MMC25_006622 [Agyrium rufum]|nr:hypothetical protein [Agyrium rufum]